MAEYIKFRLTAAKAAVTMAFLALVGGLPEAAGADQKNPTAKAASFSWGTNYLKLDGLNSATQKVFQTLEHKLNSTFLKVNHTLTASFYDKHKIDTTFLKIDTANKLYYKEQQVNASFLKIEDANTSFLKIDAASAEFLKITDANNAFLKIDATAANAQKLGGLTPDAFVQGHANVMTGTVQLNGDGRPQTLIAMADGSVRVALIVNSDGTEIIVVHNGTSEALTGVADPTAVEFSAAPGQDAQITAGTTKANVSGGTPDGSLMTHIQIFPNGVLRNVVTLTVSSEPQTQGGQITAVGQMLIGLL